MQWWYLNVSKSSEGEGSFNRGYSAYIAGILMKQYSQNVAIAGWMGYLVGMEELLTEGLPVLYADLTFEVHVT